MSRFPSGWGVIFLSELDQKFQKRQIAYKIRIIDIINSKYIRVDGFNPNYLQTNKYEISRANVIGVVVQKFEINNYKNLIIDDGTGKLSARVFETNLLLDKISVGDVVLIIGRPREFLTEKYLLIEIVNKIDDRWARVRNMELERSPLIDNYSPNEIKIEEDFGSKSKNEILKKIRDLDKGEGVTIEDISSHGFEEVDKTVELLLKEGDVFEVKPGKLKVLE